MHVRMVLTAPRRKEGYMQEVNSRSAQNWIQFVIER
jgi:hypothetical protein